MSERRHVASGLPGVNELDGAITVDLEDWRCALNPRRSGYLQQRPPIDESYLSRLTLPLLKVLKKYDSRATFFVPGEVARAAPDLIVEISRQGHEIASHAPVHLPLNLIPKDKLQTLVRDDILYIERILGRRPIGFRAPYFAIDNDDGWFFEILQKLGFRYDSSVVPTWTPFWGMPFAPKHPYYPNLLNLSKAQDSGRILEIPVTVWPSWMYLPGLPIGGGLYLRMWPRRLMNIALRNNVNRGFRLVLYIHPGDFDTGKGNLPNLSFRDSITQYLGTGSAATRLHDMLGRFKLGSIERAFSGLLVDVESDKDSRDESVGNTGR